MLEERSSAGAKCMLGFRAISFCCYYGRSAVARQQQKQNCKLHFYKRQIDRFLAVGQLRALVESLSLKIIFEV
jgi:hypothetical protein